MIVHQPRSAGACSRPWGRGRWFGPLHVCDLRPYHVGRCECSCGAVAPDGDNATYQWPASTKAGMDS